MDVIARFIDICLLKAGPQDIPASAWLMKLTLMFYFFIAVLSQLMEYSLLVSLAAGVAELIWLLLFVNILLSLRGFKARFNQTVTALAGTGALVSIIALPLVLLASDINPENMTAVQSGIMMLIMVVLLWILMITAHIFRHSAEVKAGAAVALTVVYTILTMVVVGAAMSGATP